MSIGKEFFERLEKKFSKEPYRLSGTRERQHIDKLGDEKPPDFEETLKIAGETLDGLEYELEVDKYGTEFSDKGDFILHMKGANHFFHLTQSIPGYHVYIEIFRRGCPLNDRARFEKYIRFLKDYFRE